MKEEPDRLISTYFHATLNIPLANTTNPLHSNYYQWNYIYTPLSLSELRTVKLRRVDTRVLLGPYNCLGSVSHGSPGRKPNSLLGE